MYKTFASNIIDLKGAYLIEWKNIRELNVN